MFEVDIYIETEIQGQIKGKGKYGYVVEYVLERTQEPITRHEVGVKENATINQLDLIACKEALQILNKSCRATIHINSNYIETGLKDWLHKWSKENWKNAKGEPVKNKELWKAIQNMQKKHLIRIENAKVHSYSAWLKDEMKKKEEEN